MKPFNLEAAKAGAKLVTRDGRAVDGFAHFPTVPNRNENIRFAVDGRIISCDESGSYIDRANPSGSDLFMAPTTRTVYVNLYAGISPGTMGGKGAYHYESEKGAIDAASSHAIAVAVPVTIEE